MKHQFGIAVAVFAIVAGGSIALAEDGDPPVEEPSVEVPLDEVDEGTDDEGTDDEGTDDEGTDDEGTEDEAEGVEDEGAGPPPDTHGAAVSQAAHECPTGPGGVHGQCVSAVARDHDQDGVPDHGPGSPGFTGGPGAEDDGDDAESDAESDDAGRGPGNGRGNGGGNGRGRPGG